MRINIPGHSDAWLTVSATDGVQEQQIANEVTRVLNQHATLISIAEDYRSLLESDWVVGIGKDYTDVKLANVKSILEASWRE